MAGRSGPVLASIDCRYVWDFRYEPEKVPPELIDPDEISADDVIDAMIALLAPPPGSAAPQLAPLLCPLGAGPGWGCQPAHRHGRRRACNPTGRRTRRLLMNPSAGSTAAHRTPLHARGGHWIRRLYSTRDPEEWKPYFEDLGKLCAEAWHDDLPEEDRGWAAARRERFRKWVEGPRPNGNSARRRPREAPSRAIQRRPRTVHPPVADVARRCRGRVPRVPRWLRGGARRRERRCGGRGDIASPPDLPSGKALSSGDTAEKHGSMALRAFQRGLRSGAAGGRGRCRGRSPLMLEPPWYWGPGCRSTPAPPLPEQRAIRRPA